MNAITLINNEPLEIKEFNGQRVVTFKDIDELHQRPEGTADRNFRENKKRFIESIDYFQIRKNQRDEIRGLEIPNRGIILITESGYLMLVKSLTDDLAWDVQRALVNSYFKGKTNPPPKDYLEACGIRKPDPAMTDKEVAEQFMRAIQKALESGEYYLLPKMKHTKSCKPQPGILLGIYDDTMITLISSRACEIYARTTKNNASDAYIAHLRQKLYRAGLIMPRVKKDTKRKIKGKFYCAMRIQIQAANMISGFTAPALLMANW
jgi:hypothetical protein